MTQKLESTGLAGELKWQGAEISSLLFGTKTVTLFFTV